MNVSMRNLRQEHTGNHERPLPRQRKQRFLGYWIALMGACGAFSCGDPNDPEDPLSSGNAGNEQPFQTENQETNPPPANAEDPPESMSNTNQQSNNQQSNSSENNTTTFEGAYCRAECSVA